MINLDELELAARAANPGRWSHFINLATPKSVLSIIAEIRTLRNVAITETERREHAEAERDLLLERIEKLRKTLRWYDDGDDGYKAARALQDDDKSTGSGT